MIDGNAAPKSVKKKIGSVEACVQGDDIVEEGASVDEAVLKLGCRSSHGRTSHEVDGTGDALDIGVLKA